MVRSLLGDTVPSSAHSSFLLVKARKMEPIVYLAVQHKQKACHGNRRYVGLRQEYNSYGQGKARNDQSIRDWYVNVIRERSIRAISLQLVPVDQIGIPRRN